METKSALSVLMAILAACLPTAEAAPGQAEAGFDPGADGVVYTTAVQPDGRILVGGEFTSIAGTSRPGLARLLADGSLDTTFMLPTGAGEIRALAVQADGKILAGGEFLMVSGGTGRANLARLNADGSLDTAFDSHADAAVSALALQPDGRVLVAGEFTSIGGGGWSRMARLNADGSIDAGFLAGQIDASVDCIALQPDGKILIGGNFTTVSGQSRNRIARLGADGFPDAGFNPGADEAVQSLAVQADGKVLVGGEFSTIGGEARDHLARLLADGTVDGAFPTEADGAVTVLALQADGGILAGGWFSSIGGQSCGYIARLAADGSVDMTFDPDADLPVLAISLQADGGVIVGGAFSNIGGQARAAISRLENDAATDQLAVQGNERAGWLRGGAGPEVARVTFEVSSDAGATWTPLGAGTRITGGWELTGLGLTGSGLVRARGFVGDGSIYNGSGIVERIADFQVHPGVADETFDPSANGPVYSMTVQPDGGLIVAGAFTSIGGQARGRIARFHADGTLDVDFNPGATGPVQAVALQADGKIVVGGTFVGIGGENRSNFARLNADGTVDPDFNPGASSTVRSLAVQTDGKILLGGAFTMVGTDARNRIARVHANGAVDGSFNPNAGGDVCAILLQPDGGILVGGEFTTIGGQVRNRIARLNPNGTADGSFNPGANDTVLSLGLQADGKILVGGGFTEIAGAAQARIARLHADGSVDPDFDPIVPGDLVYALAVQADGKILLGGTFMQVDGASRSRIARLGADGWLDPDFVPQADGGVLSLALQTNGRVLAGGNFHIIGGQPRDNLARLGNDPASERLAVVDGARAEWLRGGSSPELGRVNFELTVDGGGTWWPLGEGTRVPGGWEISGLALAGSGDIRARGFIHDGSYSNGSGIVESILPFDVGGDYHRVTFVLTGTGSRTGGGALTQLVAPGGAAAAPALEPLAGHAFTGWDAAFEAVTADLTVTARYAPYGTPDSDFDPVADGDVTTLALQADGKVLVGGAFATIGGGARNRIARLHPDGTLDTGFDPNASGSVYCLAVQGDGRILVGGGFGSIAGAARSYLARLNADGSLDAGFNATLGGGPVYTLAVQPDGKILLGGAFTSVAGQSRSRIARLNADGTLDGGFRPAADNAVTCMALQADGKILIGGNFTSITIPTGSGSSSYGRGRIARLNADGSLDGGFYPNADGAVNCVALQPDGKILLGGSFSAVANNFRPKLARVLSNGTLDGTFYPNPDNTVHSLALQTDGTILAGGSFALVGGVPNSKLVRLSSGGARYDSYEPYSAGSVYAISLQENGRIVAGGSFTSIGQQVRGRIARLWNNPSVTSELALTDATRAVWLRGGANPELGRVAFEVSADEGATWHPLGEGVRITGGWEITGLALAGSGRIRVQGIIQDGSLYGGSGLVEEATAFDTGGAAHLVTFDLTELGVRTGGGRLTQMIAPGAAANAPTMQVAAGWVFTGWDTGFDEVAGDLTVTARFAIAPGYPDPAFDPNVNGNVYATAQQPDGRILIGGDFGTVAGTAGVRLARLNADGSADAGFANAMAGPGPVYALAVQPDGKILVGGGFTGIAGQARNRIARLNPDGSLDTGFNPNANNVVRAVLPQPDGRILIAGDFTFVGGHYRSRIARLHPDGSPDTGFSPEANDIVYALALQPDGKVLVGGSFTVINGQTRYRVARLHSNGAFDGSFYSGVNNTVYSLAVQPDGRILMGGLFTDVLGAYRSRIARLNSNGSPDGGFAPAADNTVHSMALQADGNILLAGAFGTVSGQARSRLARVKANGAVDTGFSPSANNTVYSIALQADGGVLAAGAFTTMAGQTRNRIARIANDPATRQLAVAAASRIEWLRGGASPEADRVGFELSADGQEPWAPLGEGTRISGGWELTGLALTGAGTIRARAYVTDGSTYNGSALLESTLPFAFHSVTFDLAAKGTRTGGGELTQTVVSGSAASAPEVLGTLGWEFSGWDQPFGAVTADLTITAQYQPAPGSFNHWLAGQGLAGDPLARFHEIDPRYGIPRGFVYAFGDHLVAGDAALRIVAIGSRRVVETPLQAESTVPYVELRVVGSSDLAPGAWTLPLAPAADTTGKPAGCDWFEVAGSAPPRAFFRLEAVLKY